MFDLNEAIERKYFTEEIKVNVYNFHKMFDIEEMSYVDGDSYDPDEELHIKLHFNNKEVKDKVIKNLCNYLSQKENKTYEPIDIENVEIEAVDYDYEDAQKSGRYSQLIYYPEEGGEYTISNQNIVNSIVANALNVSNKEFKQMINYAFEYNARRYD